MKRIFSDGCFDLFHYGHANALRQAKLKGDQLYVGVNSFDDIQKNKGLPVFYDDERWEVVGSCRWVDKIIKNVPYTPTTELIESYGCNIVVHGDDLTINSDGVMVYEDIMKKLKYEEVERTRGISTTELVGRMMLLENKLSCERNLSSPADNDYINDLVKKFALPYKKKEGNVVFIDGHFDLYHAGHCKALENAKKYADYLIVGLHSDKTIKEHCKSYPILNETERKLVLMSNKYVDEIIISPYVINEDFLKKHGISKVLPSYDIKDLSRFSKIKEYVQQDFQENPFSYLSTDHIINRIISNYKQYATRQQRKEFSLN